MLFNQVDGPLGADTLDSTAVVAAEEDTQVYKLKWTTEGKKWDKAKMLPQSPGTHVVKFQPILYLFIGQASFL